MSRRPRSKSRSGGKASGPPPRAAAEPRLPAGRGRRIAAILLILALCGAGAWWWSARPGRDSGAAPDTAQTAAAPEDALARLNTAGMEPRVARLIEDAPAHGRRGAGLSGRLGRLAAALDAHSLYPEAAAAYRRARTLEPGELRWIYNLAVVQAELQADAEATAALFEEARRLDPEYVAASYRLGLLYMDLGRFEDAAGAFRRCLGPDFGWGHRELGRALLALDRVGEAVQALERAVQLMPDDAAAVSSLGQALYRAGRQARARQLIARARQMTGDRPLVDRLRREVEALGISAALCSQRASVWMAAGRYEQAIEQLRIVAETKEQDPLVQVRLGMALLSVKRLDEATRAFSRALELDPGMVRAHVQLGRLLMARGDMPRAIGHFESALALEPDHGEAHAKMAVAMMRQSRVEDALLHFERAARLDGLNAEGLVNWAVALARQGDLPGALECSRDAVDRDPHYAKGRYAVGYVLSRMDEHGRAVDHFLDAIAIDPGYAQAHVEMAASLQALGRPAEAMVHLRRAARLEPALRLEERLAALQRAADAEPGAAGAGLRVAQRPEFEAIGRRLYASNQKYLGHAAARRLRDALAGGEAAPEQRLADHAALARELIEIGEEQEAIEVVERLVRLLPEGAAVSPEQHWLRGLVYLRQAEVENCIRRHNRECCIFPLRGGGVHGEARPATQALASFEGYVRQRPADLAGRWLLNLAAMAVGRYPDGVDPAWLIPPRHFASEQDIGRFVNVAPRLGLDTFNLCGGVVVEDFDGDGWLDILTSSYDPLAPLTLYHNLSDGRFEDRSAASGVDDQLGGLNCVGADYDNDGDVDVLVLRGAWLLDHGQIRNSLLRNEGRGTFTDVTRAVGLALPACPTQAAAWGDFDNDGDLDLYIGNESRAQFGGAGGDYPSQLFVNRGPRPTGDGAPASAALLFDEADALFGERAAACGVTNDRYAKGVAVGDYDNDGDLDLYVSNSGPNRLYRNEGQLRFTDVAAQAGVVEPGGRSFACWFFDYDNDGWLDLFVAAFDASLADVAADHLGLPFEGTVPRLYHNRRDGTFRDVTAGVGLAHMYLPMGANFGDLDNDGYLDIYLTTGDPEYDTLMPNVMLRNDAGRRFVDVTTSGGLGHLQKGHGVAFADLDHDGDQDIYNQLGGFYPGDKFQNALYLNPGHGHHHLALRLVGRHSNRSAVGARITLTLETPRGPRTVHRAVGSVSSFGGSPLLQEIGLGDATRVALLEVWWPASDLRQRWTDVPLDVALRITEGLEEYEAVERRALDWAALLTAAGGP